VKTHRRNALTTVFFALVLLGAATETAASSPSGDGYVRVVGDGYRGAVLRVSSEESEAMSALGEWTATFHQAGQFKHESTLLPDEGGALSAEIIDLMFRVGLPIDVSLACVDTGETRTLSLDLEHYFPWLDWMLEEAMTSEIPDKFRYWWPECYNGQNAHSSWDYFTRAGCPVYCCTPGQIIYAVDSPNERECDVCVYNADVGGILQFGHVRPAAGIRLGMNVEAGQLIGNVFDHSGDGSGYGHIHFSVVRPAWEDKYDGLDWDLLGFRRVIANQCYYQDPFYFHEPTTWGYWRLETLPPGAASRMRALFEGRNPGVGPGTETALVRDKWGEDRCNPRASSSSAQLTIPIDGKPEPIWEDLGRRLTDKAGDTDRAGADVIAVHAYADAVHLFVRVDVEGGASDPANVAYTIEISALNYTPPGPGPASMRNVSATRATFTSANGSSESVVFAAGEVVEFAIPLRWLGECDYAKIRCETRAIGDGSTTRFDYTRTFEIHFPSA